MADEKWQMRNEKCLPVFTIHHFPFNIYQCAPIAQLDRAFDFESKGRRFESCWVHQLFSLVSF